MPSSISSVAYLFLSTTPLLLLYIYFIHLALQRPEVIAAHYDFEDDVDVNPLITLDSMLFTFLCTLILWTSLFIYLKVYVPKRRSLMQKYAEESGTQRVVGDVYYEQPKGCSKLWIMINRMDLAYVTYAHSEDGKFVQKRIRTYHPYHQERVAVTLLPGFPLSGLPHADIERDVLCYQSEHAARNKERINEVIIVCLLWMVFCLIGAIVILIQMSAVNDALPAGVEDVEDVVTDWIIFGIMICLVLPLISFGGNALQWVLHKKWIINGGSIVTNPTKIPPKTIQPDELNNDGDGGFSLI